MPVAATEYQHDGHIYCTEQINIPVILPNVLKSYAKAAIRTQPYDLLKWTAAYFRALADGLLPPVKQRLEYPPIRHPLGITPHFLKALLNQYRYDFENADNKRVGLGKRIVTSMHVSLESLLRRWHGLALSEVSLYQILVSGRLLPLAAPSEKKPPECDLYHFLAIACALLGNVSVEEELASKARILPWSASNNLEAREGQVSGSLEAARRSSRSSGSVFEATKAISMSESEPTRIPQQESRMSSERSTHDKKKEKKREKNAETNRKKEKKKKREELPEGNVGEYSGSGNVEVTKVQEVRRRDVEVHSSTENPSPVDNATELLLDSTDASSSSSSSSSRKSHVGFSEPVKTAFDSPTQSPETDEILATRSLELFQELENSKNSKKTSPSSTNQNISDQVSTTARNNNSQHTNINEINSDVSGQPDRDKKNQNSKVNTVENTRDSFEYDDPTSGEQIRDDESSSRDEKQSRNSLEGIENKNSMDFIVDDVQESFERVANDEFLCSEDEQVEEMSEYNPIGLENVLQGLCGCLQPSAEETRDSRISVSDASSLDLVLEFIEKMRSEHSKGILKLLPEVPGIGPRVSSKRVTEVGLWLGECARRQQGYVAPRNLRHFLCPNLQEDTPYEDYYKTKTMCP